MKSNRRSVIWFFLLALVVNINNTGAEMLASLPVEQEKINDSFVANNIMVGKLFDVLSERLEKPIILSKSAAQSGLQVTLIWRMPI